MVSSWLRTTDEGTFEAGEINLYSLENPSEVRPLITTVDQDEYYGGAVISPDGRWLAYVHGDTDNDYEVYIQPFPDGGARYKVSQEGGFKPLWAPDGSAIYFRQGPSGNPMYRARVSLGERPVIGAPEPLFTDHYSFGVYPSVPGYDPIPGTSDLLMVKLDDELGQSSEIRLVINWLDELAHTPTSEN